MTPTSLQLTSTDDLVRELSSRYDCFIFSATTKISNDNAFIGKMWHGEPMRCLGLASMMTDVISASIHKSVNDKGEKI